MPGSSKREFAVGGALLGFDPEHFGKLVENIARALYIAGGAEANRDVVFSLGRQCELRVEGGYTVNLLKRNAQTLCDHCLNLDGQVSVDFLCLLKHGHDSAGIVNVLGNDFL